MNLAVSDALVTGFESLIPTLKLPPPDDRPVPTASLHGQCDVIVTYNLKDFPSEVLSQFDLEAQHPDEFISHLIPSEAGRSSSHRQEMQSATEVTPQDR